MLQRLNLSRTELSLAIGIGLGILAMGLAGSLFLAALGARAFGFVPAPAPTLPPLFGPTDPAPLPTPTPGPGTSAAPTATPFQAAADCSGKERINILILGIDSRENDYSQPVRTDTIMVAGVNYADRTAALLSFPRDLYVALAGLADYGITEGRINTAYAYGESHDLPGGGAGVARETVTLNFGIRLHRHIVVNFQAFVDLVDALDGIDVDVPVPIYDDRFPAEEGFGTIVFSMPAGLQHMDGITALRYARTRHQDADYGRIKRQQQVLLAIRDKALQPEVLLRLPAIAEALYGAVRTDLSLSELASLLCIGQRVDRSAIQTYAIDANYVMDWRTDDGAAVIIPRREAIAPIVREFNGEE